MYIFELISKIIKDIKKPKPQKIKKEIEECEHVFVPVDSTKKVLACINCGILMKNNKKKDN